MAHLTTDELDALEPRTLIDLIEGEITEVIDQTAWDERTALADKGQTTLRAVRENYGAVLGFLRDTGHLSV